MSSFTIPLTLEKQKNGLWRVYRSFEYHIGEEASNNIIHVPKEFETDLASIPRIFWTILPPDGKYSASAVLHDFLYFKKGEIENPGSRVIGLYSRKECDKIFLESMEVLKVPLWKRRIMYRAVRLFGFLAW